MIDESKMNQVLSLVLLRHLIGQETLAILVELAEGTKTVDLAARYGITPQGVGHRAAVGRTRVRAVVEELRNRMPGYHVPALFLKLIPPEPETPTVEAGKAVEPVKLTRPGYGFTKAQRTLSNVKTRRDARRDHSSV